MKRAHRFEVVLPGRELPELLSLLKKDYTSSELDRFSPTQEQEHGDEIERVVFADRDAMGVAAEIVEDLPGACELTFGILDPFDIAELRQMAGESRWFAQAG